MEVSGMVVGLIGTILGVPLVETTGMAMELSGQCSGRKSHQLVQVCRGMEQLILQIYEHSFQSRALSHGNSWTKSVHQLQKQQGTSELILREARDAVASKMVFGSIYPHTVKHPSQRYEAPMIVLWRNRIDESQENHDKVMYSTVLDSITKNYWNIDAAVQILQQSGVMTEPGDVVFLSERI